MVRPVSRSIPLINSIPYIKDWVDQHPHSGNPNSILLCGFSKSVGKKLNTTSLGQIYNRYKNEYFPKLCQDPNVPSEDKHKIRVTQEALESVYAKCIKPLEYN